MAESAGRPSGGVPEYSEMGGRLRDARLSRGLSLRELAQRLGVSPSLISQVETGRAKPSVSTLYAIASELEISLDELLFPDAVGRGAGVASTRVTGDTAPVGIVAPDAASLAVQTPAPAVTSPRATAVAEAVASALTATPDAFPPVQPAETRKKIRLASGVIWERLTSVSMPNVDFFYVTYEVGGASSPEHEFQRHAGQEWGYIISGTLHVTIAFDDYVLGPGDAISFDSTTPHRLANLSEEPVHAIWFMLGRRPAEVTPGRESAPPAGGSAEQPGERG